MPREGCCGMRCPICNATATFDCPGRCGSRKYCSAHHVKLDWRHFEECRKIKAARMSGMAPVESRAGNDSAGLDEEPSSTAFIPELPAAGATRRRASHVNPPTLPYRPPSPLPPVHTDAWTARLGRASWTLLFSLADAHPGRPSHAEASAAASLIHSLAAAYPCEKCRAHFVAHISAFPPSRAVNSRSDLQAWVKGLKAAVDTAMNVEREMEMRHEREYGRPRSSSTGASGRSGRAGGGGGGVTARSVQSASAGGRSVGEAGAGWAEAEEEGWGPVGQPDTYAGQGSYAGQGGGSYRGNGAGSVAKSTTGAGSVQEGSMYRGVMPGVGGVTGAGRWRRWYG